MVLFVKAKYSLPFNVSTKVVYLAVLKKYSYEKDYFQIDSACPDIIQIFVLNFC